MSTNPNEAPDPEDMFNDTRMSFGDHIEDLRTHLFRALKGFVIGMVLGIWPLGQFVLGIITAPVEEQLQEFVKKKTRKDTVDAKIQIDRGSLRLEPVVFKMKLFEVSPTERDKPEVLKKTIDGFQKLLFDLNVHEVLDRDLRERGNVKVVHAQIDDPFPLVENLMNAMAQIRRPGLSTMSITEGFVVYFKVALLTGFVISSPWVFYHVWMFIAAGLYPNEKKVVNVYLPFSLFLFMSGVVLCQFWVMPRAVGALLWFNEWLGFDADLRLNEWLGFAMLMPLVFGLSFQTPLVMLFMHRIGIASVQDFRDKRRIAWFSMSIFAALITPTPDPMTMMFLWVPMGCLYELGIILCVYQGEQESLAEWEIEERNNELVEV